jgi:hypothetical protein
VLAVCALLTGTTFLAGCGNPKQSVRNCVGVSDQVVQAIQKQVARGQTLRNGRMVHVRDGKYAFVSAELHPRTDAPHDKGDIGTWATRDVKSADGFLAVDVHARDESSWPTAPFKVTADGAIESRACVGLSTGKTRAQVECERSATSGENLPTRKDCSDL